VEKLKCFLQNIINKLKIIKRITKITKMTKMTKFIKTVSKSLIKTHVINNGNNINKYFTTIPPLKPKKYVIPISTQKKYKYDYYYTIDYRLGEIMNAYTQTKDHNWSKDPTKFEPFNPNFINDIREKLNAEVELSQCQIDEVNNVYYAFYQKGLFK